MKLHSARIRGYQSFTDSGEIGFTDGINLIVGQNNAGKSALLRALQPTLSDDRHRTPERWEDAQLPAPHVELVIDLSGDEVRRELLRMGQTFIPVPEEVNFAAYATELLDRPTLQMKVDHHAGNRFSASYPSHRSFDPAAQRNQMSVIMSPAAGEFQMSQTLGSQDSLPEVTHRMWERSMFYFSAERMNIGRSHPAYTPRLSSNASNLPDVLLTLAGDRGDILQRLVSHLREVFPTVGNLSVRPTPDGFIEVRVWPTEEMQRVELSFPLLQSGTGVAQVIAILAAVMTVDDAVIMIDEINSFLHPAAVKVLLRILQTEYSQHQYVISTHAPEVVGFSNPRTVHLVKRNRYESNVSKLDLKQVDAFREVAEHLGVSMADVFAADRVIWVEGPTEELCFPLLYQQATGQPLPRGTIFTSVMATGDFMTKRRDKELVYQIYRRLTDASVPLVVGVAFSFDSEMLSEADKAQMKRDARGALNFLPRRHIECYLICPVSLAEFLNIRDAACAPKLGTDEVARRFAELAESDRFRVNEWAGDLSEVSWQARVDAANLLATACTSLSEQRVTFNKKDDTLALLKLVQKNRPDMVTELGEYVREIVHAIQ